MKGEFLFLFVAAFIIFAALNVKRIVFFGVAAMLIVIPLSNAAFMPRSVFGVTGLNTANIVWLFAFILVSLTMLRKKRSLRFGLYLSIPVSMFIVLFLLAAVRTIIDIQSLPNNIQQITRMSILIDSIIKPIQIFFVGWIVMATCELEGRQKVQRVIYLIPIMLAPMQLYYFSIGGSNGNEYTMGRNMISTSIGYHANELGAVGTYLLAIIILIKDDGWYVIRYISIGASLLIVAISFSRMAYITTVILFSLTFFKLQTKEKTLLVSLVVVVVVVFSAQLMKRAYFGMDSGSSKTDINAISANRIDGLWLPLVPHMADHLIIGSGVYGLLKAGSLSKYLPNHPHNAYLQIILDVGLIGLLSLFFMLRRFFIEDKRTDKTFRYLVMCWMLMGLTGHSFYPMYANLLIWVGYGLMLAAMQEKSMTANTVEEKPLVIDYRNRTNPIIHHS